MSHLHCFWKKPLNINKCIYGRSWNLIWYKVSFADSNSIFVLSFNIKDERNSQSLSGLFNHTAVTELQ